MSESDPAYDKFPSHVEKPQFDAMVDSLMPKKPAPKPRPDFVQADFEPTIKKTKRLTREKWLNLYQTTFDKNGSEGNWIFASRGRAGRKYLPTGKPNAVVIVPVVIVEGTRQLVLIKEYRVAVQGWEWHFPAGLIDGNESVIEAAERELQEEAGLQLTLVRRISPLLYSSAGMTDETSVMAFVDCIPHGEQHLEKHEEIIPVWADIMQINAVLNSGSPIAAKTWPVLLMYKEMGHFVLPAEGERNDFLA